LTGLLTILALGLLIAQTAAIGYTLRMLTRPPRRTYAGAVARGLPGDPSELSPALPFTQWSFNSRRRELPVWDITGLNPEGPTLILSHGWGESRTTSLPRLAALAPLCSRLIAWDMPGHGMSPGSCSLGIHEPQDLLALISALNTHPTAAKIDIQSATQYNIISQKHASTPRPIILYGFSLGAGISIAAAAQRCRSAPNTSAAAPATAPSNPIAAVIAEAPYRLPRTPANNVLKLTGFPRVPNLDIALALHGLDQRAGLTFATSRSFDRAAHAKSLTIPLLILQGTADAVTPPQDAQSIANAASSATLYLIPNCEHLDMWTHEVFRTQALQACANFIHKLTLESDPNSSPPTT
jgi:pimeloyl-ACP methyl ester carboxylesterase